MPETNVHLVAPTQEISCVCGCSKNRHASVSFTDHDAKGECLDCTCEGFEAKKK
jgi:hypothetical protein